MVHSPAFTPVTTKEQIDTTARLAAEIWRECYGPILDPAQIDYMLATIQSADAIGAQIKDKGYQYFLIEDGGEAAGYIGVQPEDGKLLLSKLYVHQRCRGAGFGRTGLAFTEELAKQLGCTHVWLTVNRHNQRAIEVYQSKGFAVTREQVADIGGGFVMDDFILEKAL